MHPHLIKILEIHTRPHYYWKIKKRGPDSLNKYAWLNLLLLVSSLKELQTRIWIWKTWSVGGTRINPISIKMNAIRLRILKVRHRKMIYLSMTIWLLTFAYLAMREEWRLHITRQVSNHQPTNLIKTGGKSKLLLATNTMKHSGISKKKMLSTSAMIHSLKHKRLLDYLKMLAYLNRLKN